MMAASWHELAGAQGNKNSQAWMVNYLEARVSESWFQRAKYTKKLKRWKTLISQKEGSNMNSELPKSS
jgi:hypothetical protein